MAPRTTVLGAIWHSMSVNAPHAQTASWAADRLRQDITRGRLLPGVKLAEQQLATQLEVSRNTLREAFTTLAAEGMVERFPNRGVFVKRPTAADIREIYRVRRMVEPAAVLWGEVPDDALERMGAIVTEAARARAAGEVPAMAAANEALHREVVGLTQSATLLEAMERVMLQTRLVFFTMVSVPDFHTHYVDGNVNLVRRLRAGERAEAAQELRAYLDAAEAELLGHLGR